MSKHHLATVESNKFVSKNLVPAMNKAKTLILANLKDVRRKSKSGCKMIIEVEFLPDLKFPDIINVSGVVKTKLAPEVIDFDLEESVSEPSSKSKAQQFAESKGVKL